jgi:hypothetical protein
MPAKGAPVIDAAGSPAAMFVAGHLRISVTGRRAGFCLARSGVVA